MRAKLGNRKDNTVVLLDIGFQLLGFGWCYPGHQGMIEHRQYEPEIKRRFAIHCPCVVVQPGNAFRQACYG